MNNLHWLIIWIISVILSLTVIAYESNASPSIAVPVYEAEDAHVGDTQIGVAVGMVVLVGVIYQITSTPDQLLDGFEDDPDNQTVEVVADRDVVKVQINIPSSFPF